MYYRRSPSHVRVIFKTNENRCQYVAGRYVLGLTTHEYIVVTMGMQSSVFPFFGESRMKGFSGLHFLHT